MMFVRSWKASSMRILDDTNHLKRLDPHAINDLYASNGTIDPNTLHNHNIVPEVLDIETSKYDKRKYRGFVIDKNRLTVLVISDNETISSAAAMDVKAGSRYDPDEIPGIAHFLEHMLFMGSKKYPEEDYYSNWLSQHGGASNAFTAFDHTNYYFNVNPSNLADAMKLFSRFFIDPTLDFNAMEREAHAVDSEHSKNLQDDVWREQEVLKTLAKPPFSRFSTGNLMTLMSNPNATYAALRKFHDEFYCACNMKLAVIGRESLDELQTMVTSLFSEISAGCSVCSSNNGNHTSESQSKEDHKPEASSIGTKPYKSDAINQVNLSQMNNQNGNEHSTSEVTINVQSQPSNQSRLSSRTSSGNQTNGSPVFSSHKSTIQSADKLVFYGNNETKFVAPFPTSSSPYLVLIEPVTDRRKLR